MAAKCQYSLSEIISDLLQFAAQYLTLGGRLVFWLPIYRQQSVSLSLSLSLTQTDRQTDTLSVGHCCREHETSRVTDCCIWPV